MLKRFGFEGQDSITNPNPNIIRLEKNHESESEYSGFGGKDSNPNPNPNIRYNTDIGLLRRQLAIKPALSAKRWKIL